MPQDLGYGTAFLATATGTVNITTRDARVIGILFQGSATGSCRLFAGTTSTGLAAAITHNVVAYGTTGATVNPALYFPVPAFASGGLTAVVGPSADAKLTIFWVPA